LHDEWVASVLGITLGVAFTVCFLTGLVDYLAQHPPTWFHLPARPVNLYRVTEGVHVVTGIATIPLLLGKLWTVWPKLFAWPPIRNVAQALERLSLIPLVGGSLFLLITGVANIDYWYSPMPFFFPTAHFWTAWMVVGALVIHIAAKRRPPARRSPEDPRRRWTSRRGHRACAGSGDGSKLRGGGPHARGHRVCPGAGDDRSHATLASGLRGDAVRDRRCARSDRRRRGRSRRCSGWPPSRRATRRSARRTCPSTSQRSRPGSRRRPSTPPTAWG